MINQTYWLRQQQVRAWKFSAPVQPSQLVPGQPAASWSPSQSWASPVQSPYPAHPICGHESTDLDDPKWKHWFPSHLSDPRSRVPPATPPFPTLPLKSCKSKSEYDFNQTQRNSISKESFEKSAKKAQKEVQSDAMYICTLNLQWNSPSKGYPMKLKQMTNWGWPFYVSLIMSLMVCKTFWNTNLPMQRSVNNRDVTTVLQVVVFLCIYIQQSNCMPPKRIDLLLN